MKRGGVFFEALGKKSYFPQARGRILTGLAKGKGVLGKEQPYSPMQAKSFELITWIGEGPGKRLSTEEVQFIMCPMRS